MHKQWQNKYKQMIIEVLASMDLPPDKAKVLRGYDDEKKWEMIKDQDKVSAKNEPEFYLKKLRTYLDPKAYKSSKKRKIIGDLTSTQVLRELEISLRTNNIEWVREFLSEKNCGLDILIDYLTFRLTTQQQQQQRELEERLRLQEQENLEAEAQNNENGHNNNSHHSTLNGNSHLNGTSSSSSNNHVTSDSSDHHLHARHHRISPFSTLTPVPLSPLLSSSFSAKNGNQYNYQHHLRRYNLKNSAGGDIFAASITSTSSTANALRNFSSSASQLLFRRPSMFMKQINSNRLKFGSVDDDVHVCIMCMRAIMNNKYGFNLVMEHLSAINCISLSLNHQSLRTKSLVLELLAAICLVKGGHELILSAFDHFKDVCCERKRFQTLMHYFMNFDNFNIDFMVACMQFINIIVHSVEDMNFRVHLQYEFTQLGLDDYLENKLRNTESEELQVQIQAYLDNVFDVAALMEDAEVKTNAMESVNELSAQLSHTQELVRDWQSRYDAVERVLHEACQERDSLLADKHRLESDLKEVRKVIDAKEEESKRQQSLLETKIQQLESIKSTTTPVINGTTLKTSPIVPEKPSESSPSSPPQAISSPPPPPPPPPMPPMIGAVGMSVPPPPPPMPMCGGSKMEGIVPPPPPPMGIPLSQSESNPNMFTIKKNFTTKFKLPTFNWVPLKPNQVKGTIFNEFHDEEKIVKMIDFGEFEEQFKLGPKGAAGANINNNLDVGRANSSASNSTTGSSGTGINSSKRFKAPEKVSMLENNRLRNMAISLKKLNTSTDIIIRTINTFDVDNLTLEQMEILLRMIPTPAEISVYKDYERAGKSIDDMTDEDKFLLSISKIERLEQKAKILYFMSSINAPVVGPGNQTIVQVCRSRIAILTEASRSLMNSPGIRSVLEYILVFGNYMNCSTRTMASGPAYGFKLQTLDLITETKSTQDRTRSLLHYVVDVVGKNHNEAPSSTLSPTEEQLKAVSPTTAVKKFEPISLENTRLPFDLDKLQSLLERAAALSMETVSSEVIDLDRSMELARKELSIRKQSATVKTKEGDMTTSRLASFVNSKGPEVSALREDLKRTQQEYNECVQYFGENPKLLESSSYLFGAFAKFLKQYRQCLFENRVARRKKLEEEKQAMERQLSQQENKSSTASNGSSNDKKNGPSTGLKEKKLIGAQDLYNGAFEDILMELKSAPYRRADAVRRSLRRKNNGDISRLSGTDMDI